MCSIGLFKHYNGKLGRDAESRFNNFINNTNEIAKNQLSIECRNLLVNKKYRNILYWIDRGYYIVCLYMSYTHI